MRKLLTLVSPLATLLQCPELDILKAIKLVESTILALKDCIMPNYFRDNVYPECLELARELNIPILANRSEVGIGKCEFYRGKIFEPALKMLIDDLESRCQKREIGHSKIACLLESDTSLENLMQMSEIYYSALGFSNANELLAALDAERRLLMRHCPDIFDKTKIQDPLLVLIEKTTEFKNVNTLLRILAVTTISNASAERSFSSLRRLKTYLRSTMTQERLSSIATVMVNREIAPDLSEVVEAFLKSDRKIVEQIK